MRHNMLSKAALGLACLAVSSWAVAQDKPAPTKTAAAAPSFSELIEKAGAKFQPLTDKDVAAAKKQLKASVARLSTYLDNNGPHGQGWKTYFRWTDLEAQLAGAAEPKLGTLDRIRKKFIADYEGLDWDVYASVGDDLGRYIEVARYASAKDQKAVYDAQLKALATDLGAYGKKPTEIGAYAIGARLGYLEATGQATDVVNAVRSRASLSNLHIQTSAKFVDVGMSRDLAQKDPIYDNILGVAISGTGHTTGKLSVSLAESADKAVIETKMVATIHSETVGQKGPATVWSKGTTQVSATKQLTFTGDRLNSAPARASATTSTEFQGIYIKPRFLEKAVWRKAYKKKGQAEYVAARHAEWRVQEKMDAQAGELIAKTNSKIDDRFRLPLLRLRAYPQSLAVSTTTDKLQITALQASSSQIAAPTAAPALDDGSDLAVRIHESLLNNLAARTLAGNTYNDDQLKATLKDLTGKVPEELKNDQDKDPWSITFERTRPVIFEFDGQHFSLTIRGREFTSGDRKYKAMNISVKYKIEKTSKGSKLTRVGDIQFAPPGHKPGKTLSAAQIALRTILQKKLKNAFKPVIESDGLQLKGQFEKVGKLRLAQLASDGGWLTLAWKIPEKAAAAAATRNATAAKVVSK